LETELRILVNQAGTGVISREVVPVSERPPPGVGSQLDSGALSNQVAAGMRDALHDYRDEASRKVRRFGEIVRSEAGMERLYRKRHRRLCEDLRLEPTERATLARWRERSHPVQQTTTVRLSDDPTAGEREIEPLETEAGLTWTVARQDR
jgi:hypothetical protein